MQIPFGSGFSSLCIVSCYLRFLYAIISDWMHNLNFKKSLYTFCVSLCALTKVFSIFILNVCFALCALFWYEHRFNALSLTHRSAEISLRSQMHSIQNELNWIAFIMLCVCALCFIFVFGQTHSVLFRFIKFIAAFNA